MIICITTNDIIYDYVKIEGCSSNSSNSRGVALEGEEEEIQEVLTVVVIIWSEAPQAITATLT